MTEEILNTGDKIINILSKHEDGLWATELRKQSGTSVGNFYYWMEKLVREGKVEMDLVRISGVPTKMKKYMLVK